MQLTPEKKSMIRAEMNGLSGKAARTKAMILQNQLAQAGTQISIEHIYRVSKDVRPARKQRSDKGKLKAIDESGLDTLMYYTTKHDMAASHVVEIAEANGVATISPARYNAIIRERRMDRKTMRTAVKPWQSWGADYPNQIHQIDTTLAEQFYIDDDLSIGVEEPGQRYKNKPGNQKTRLTLFSLIDDFSRCAFAMFVPTNTTESWMNAMYEAWRIKDDARGFPFHGLPKILYSDNDSVIKSGKFTRAMEILDVKVIRHGVGHSQAKGKVENAFKVYAEFQKVTRIKKWPSVEAANRDLWDFLYYKNGKRHTSTGMVPFASWITIRPEHLRAVPSRELFNLLRMDWTKRQIRPDLTISLNGRLYQLPFKTPYINHIKQSVEVFWTPGDTERLFVVLDGKSYEVQPKDKMMRRVGEAKKELPVPAFLQKRDELQERDDPGLKVTGIYKDKYRKPYLSPQANKPFDESKVDSGIADVQRSRAWFILELRTQHFYYGQADHNVIAFVDNVFQGGKTMPESELRKAIQRLKDGKVSLSGRDAANL